MSLSLRIGGREIEVVTKAAKGLRSSVSLRNGKVELKLSRFLRGSARKATVAKFLDWAEVRLSNTSSDFLLPEYRDGGVVPTHNCVYFIELNESKRKNVKVAVEKGVIRIEKPDSMKMSDSVLRDRVERAVMKDQRAYLEEVVAELNAQHFNEKYTGVRFKRTKSRFGSCSTKRNINISYRLLFAPREVFRYVCVHELAHLKEMNHSNRFWAHVASAMPNYKDSEKWLRQNGFMLG